MLDEEKLILTFLKKQNLEEYFGKDFLGDPDAAPSGQGVLDPFLARLLERIRFGGEELYVPFLDIGCGNGRLLGAILRRRDWPLSRIQYVGMDRIRQRVENAETYAKESGAQANLCSVEFCQDIEELGNYVQSHARDPRPFRFRWMFLINVLHEIALEDLPRLFEHLILWLARRGCLLIQELSVLPKAEDYYIPWDSESLRIMFSLPGLDFSSELHKSSRGLPVVHICVRKLLRDYECIDRDTWHSHVRHEVVPFMKLNVERRLHLSRPQKNNAAYVNYALALQNIEKYEKRQEIIDRYQKTYSHDRTSGPSKIPESVVIV